MRYLDDVIAELVKLRELEGNIPCHGFPYDGQARTFPVRRIYAVNIPEAKTITGGVIQSAGRVVLFDC